MKHPHPLTTSAVLAVAVIAASAVTLNVRQQLPINAPTACTITAKDAHDGAEQIEHLSIDTADCGNFRIADPVTEPSRGPADLYRSLDVGHRYVLETRGDRIELLGLTPSIVAATPAQ